MFGQHKLHHRYERFNFMEVYLDMISDMLGMIDILQRGKINGCLIIFLL